MSFRGQKLQTVDELPSEENRGRVSEVQRRVQTAYGTRPRYAEEYQTLPPQEQLEPMTRESGLRFKPPVRRAVPPQTDWDQSDELFDRSSETPLPQSKSKPSSSVSPDENVDTQRPLKDGTLLYKSKIHPPQSTRPASNQYEQLVGAFQTSMKDLTAKMDRSFQQMASKLYQMDRRLDGARERVESLQEEKEEETEMQSQLPPQRRSFIHPPVTSVGTTQTVAHAEVQATETPQDKGVRSLADGQPKKVIDPPAVKEPPAPKEAKTRTEPATKDFESQTPVDQSRELQEELIDQLTTMWLETLELLKTGNLKAAYRKVLETGDDIYLLRLIHKTGVCLKELDVTTGLTVIRRLGQIMHSYFLEGLGLQWIEETVQKGVFFQLPGDVQKGLLEALYSMSAMPTDEGVSAAQMYTYLTSSGT